MNSLKYKLILTTIAVLLAVFISMDLLDASKDIDGFQFSLKLISALGFSSAALALTLGGRATFLNNAVMLLLGLPSLVLIGISIWGYISGSLTFRFVQLIPLGIYSVGIILSGSIINEAEARAAKAKEKHP